MACDRDCRCNACICDMFDFRKNQGPVPPGHGGLVATLGRVNNLPDELHAARRLAIARGRGRVPDRPWPAASAARGALFWPAFPDRTTFWPRGDELYSGRLPLDDPQWHPPITILNGPGSSVTVTP